MRCERGIQLHLRCGCLQFGGYITEEREWTGLSDLEETTKVCSGRLLQVEAQCASILKFVSNEQGLIGLAYVQVNSCSPGFVFFHRLNDMMIDSHELVELARLGIPAVNNGDILIIHDRWFTDVRPGSHDGWKQRVDRYDQQINQRIDVKLDSR